MFHDEQRAFFTILDSTKDMFIEVDDQEIHEC